MEDIKTLEKTTKLSALSVEFAETLDEKDPLHSFREEFNIPLAREVIKSSAESNKLTNSKELVEKFDSQKDCVYFVGNLIGLQPKKVVELVNEKLRNWETFPLREDSLGDDTTYRKEMETIIGAKSGEVVLMNSLTVNLTLGMTTFYKPQGTRSKILLEAHPFPTELYICVSHIKLHGLDPESHLIVLEPREGESTLRTEDILDKIEQEGEHIAIILLSAVHFYTGQLFEIEKITIAGRGKGCYVGLDLAHAAGNVPLYLHEWGVDFASWCPYKYLNGGHGGVGGLFVHERHSQSFELPRLVGWWGHDPSTRMQMDNNLILEKGAPGFAQSAPSQLSLACMKASTDIFMRAGMQQIRNKSIILTGYLEYLLTEGFSDNPKLKGLLQIITPQDVNQRGCQISVACKYANNISTKLFLQGIATDFKNPNILRITPMPLYNRFTEVLQLYHALREVLVQEVALEGTM